MKSLVLDADTANTTGATLTEHLALLAMRIGARATRPARHRGLSLYCRTLNRFLPERDITLRLANDALFSFPLGDPYWTRLLDPRSIYEPEVQAFLLAVADVDYDFIDCGANFGYWSVLVSSKRFGNHRALAIEPSRGNYRRLCKNRRLNIDRFAALRRAVGHNDSRTGWLAGAKHEGLRLVEPESDGIGEEVEVVSLDGLAERGFLKFERPLIVKLDVEGMEIDAIRGSTACLHHDVALICEDHSSDSTHRVSRCLLDELGWQIYLFQPTDGTFSQLTDIAMLARCKAASTGGYNVFAFNGPLWRSRMQQRLVT